MSIRESANMQFIGCMNIDDIGYNAAVRTYAAPDKSR
jgi:hypothetical protein